jgi:hypothetical protein
MIAGTAIMNRNGRPGCLNPRATAIPDSRDLIGAGMAPGGSVMR